MGPRLTNNHDADTDQDRPSSSETFTDETGCDSTEKSTDLVNGDDQRDEVGALLAVWINTKGLGKGWTADETSHETIVETDEQEAETCQSGDGGEEGITLKLEAHDGYRM